MSATTAPTLITPPASLPRGAPDGMSLRLAVILLYFALLVGSGAWENLRFSGPTKVAGFTFIMIAATLLLSKRHVIGNLVFPVPFAMFIIWIVASYAWSNNPPGFFKATGRDVLLAIAVVVALQVLPLGYAVRTIIRAGYVAIALIFVTLAVHPNLAYEAGVGLRGGFIHKNAMSPNLLLTLCTVFAFEHRRLIRAMTLSLVVVLIVLGRSTTGLAALVLLSALYYGLKRLPAIRRASGRAVHFVIAAASLVAGAVFYVLSSSLVVLAGKDLTFSSRTLIWKSVSQAIPHKALYGYGWAVWSNELIEPVLSINQRLGFFLRVAEAHNLVLELLLRLGLVGLLLYFIQLLSSVRIGFSLLKNGNPLGILTTLYIVLMMTFGFSEAFPASGLWLGLLAGLAAAGIRQGKSLHPPLESATT